MLETSPAVGCGQTGRQTNLWHIWAHLGTMLNQGNSKCINMLHFQVAYPTVNLASSLHTKVWGTLLLAIFTAQNPRIFMPFRRRPVFGLQLSKKTRRSPAAPVLVVHHTLGQRNSTSISGLSDAIVGLPSVNGNLFILGHLKTLEDT